jgi:hypothetical protein
MMTDNLNNNKGDIGTSSDDLVARHLNSLIQIGKQKGFEVDKNVDVGAGLIDVV